MAIDRRESSSADTPRYFWEWDRAKIISESKELLNFINRQVFNQIPSVSAVIGLLAGAWVSSTFTTSPLKGQLASWGLIKGGRHVISSGSYKLLSIVLPILAIGVTAYVVQKALKVFRGRQLERNMAKAAQLGKEVQAELQGKLTLLEKAREAGLVSEGEYSTKRANLYHAYSRILPPKIEEFIIRKLTG